MNLNELKTIISSSELNPHIQWNDIGDWAHKDTGFGVYLK